MKQWKLAGLIVALMLIGMRTASAVPVVDGTITGTEWDVFNVSASDSNEGGITDNWDIDTVKVFRDNDGAGSDAWYFLMTTFDTPTFAGGPGSDGDEAFFIFRFDFNKNGVTTDAVDRVVRFNQLSGGEVEVFNGTGTFLGAGTGALSDVIEISAGESLFPDDDTYQGRARLDNAGDESDDNIPNEGFYTPPVIPEPTSMILFGVGLLGGVARKKLGLF